MSVKLRWEGKVQMYNPVVRLIGTAETKLRPEKVEIILIHEAVQIIEDAEKLGGEAIPDPPEQSQLKCDCVIITLRFKTQMELIKFIESRNSKGS